MVVLLAALTEGKLLAEDWSVALVDSTIARNPDPAQFGAWAYPQALDLYGTYLVYKRTGKPQYLKYIKAWTDSHVDNAGHIDHSLDALDDWLAGNLLIVLWDETHDMRYKRAAESIRHRLDSYPRMKDGSLWHSVAWPNQVWLDGLYMSMPFLMRYGNTFGDSADARSEAARQLRQSSGHLKDQITGLYFHAYDDSGSALWAAPESHHSQSFWARSMGWYGMAIVDILDLMPQNDPNRETLIAMLGGFITSISRYQDPKTGLWYQVVDRADLSQNWLETSGSSMYVYTILKAVEHGYVSRGYLPIADKGYAGVLSRVSNTQDGMANLSGICEGTNVGDLNFYLTRSKNTNDLHGLGAFLLMNEAMLEFNRTNRK